MDKDLQSIHQARTCVESVYEAWKLYADFPQEKVDAIVQAVAQAGWAAAEPLARMAVDETGFGKYEDKILKNKFGSMFVYNAIKDLKTVGILREDHEKGILEIATPVGVIAAIIPSTNPTSTTLNKVQISLKARNGIVLSPHPSASKCIQETARIVTEAARAAGAPEGLIQCITVSTTEGTQELMKHRRTALILATGGHGLVRAAYSAGKPAYGVGPGNVPAYIEPSADIRKAVKDVFTGKCFDNGTLCSSEQAIVTDEAIKDKVVSEIISNGGYFLNEEQTETLGRLVVTPSRAINPKIVGRSAAVIASMAGLRVPEGTQVLVAELKGVGRDFPLSMEKLSPILAFYVEKNWQAACERCIELVNYGGLGHTLSIHSKNDEIIRQFGLQKPVFRVIVNSQSALGAVGYTTGLFPSMTLGCGSLGGNITSDNLSPLHLINIRRVAYETGGWRPARLAAPVPPTISKSREPRIETTRHEISEVIDKLLSQRNIPLPASPPLGSWIEPPQASAPPPPPACPLPPSAPPPPAPAPRPAATPFVCEDDVRTAIKNNQKIYVNSKTIITPSGRDLGTDKGVLVFVD
ncbi:MAG: acetaldehyde dehydrogenase (acetylating) [Terriglobia bacterium]